MSKVELPLNVNFSRPLVSVQDMVNFIDKGEKYLKSKKEGVESEDELEFLQGIILSPDYQREYRSTSKEESSIIESIIVGIPIPEVFLVRTSNDGIQLRHVMDGQHRLTAIYRFVKNRFALTELELLKDDEKYKNKRFSQLDREIKFKILGSHISVLEFEAFENDEVEIELFKRYNRNTKPLEKHEMSMATFYSNASLYITNFLNDNMEKAEKDEKAKSIVKIYNITSDRKNKQRNHQELCILFSILNNGPNLNYKDGVEIANKYLEEQSKLYKSSNEEEALKLAKQRFEKFNEFMLTLMKKVEYPFSIALLKGDDKRSTKFHTGVSMVLAIICYYFKIDLDNPSLIEDVKCIMQDSPLGDETYKASSTNMRNVMAYLYKKHAVFNKKYDSLTYKENISQDIIDALNGKDSIFGGKDISKNDSTDVDLSGINISDVMTYLYEKIVAAYEVEIFQHKINAQNKRKANLLCGWFESDYCRAEYCNFLGRMSMAHEFPREFNLYSINYCFEISKLKRSKLKISKLKRSKLKRNKFKRCRLNEKKKLIPQMMFFDK